jgi:hypothetical protein
LKWEFYYFNMQNYTVLKAGDAKGLSYQNYEITTRDPGMPDLVVPVRTAIALNATRSQVIVTYNEPLSGNPLASDYTATGMTITAASVVGSTVLLTLSPIPAAGVALTLAYTGTTVKDKGGNNAPTFAATTVPNP